MSDEPTASFNHSGSSFDSFLEDEGILDEVVAIKHVIAWQSLKTMDGDRTDAGW